MQLVTLTTDFGLDDPFVGIMKGVILGIAAEARLLDLTHLVPPQDILAGALALEAGCPHMPDGTIHLAVVDPGVGSERAAIAVESARAKFIGPDNGLFTLALHLDPALRAVRLTNAALRRHPVSHTFHGRDIFAPAAAHLATGIPLDHLGETIDPGTLANVEMPAPRISADMIEAAVIHVDRFGNAITNLRVERLAEWLTGGGDAAAYVDGRQEPIPLVRTYADVAAGDPAAYAGSGGRLEIGVREGSARESLGLVRGSLVQLR